MNQQILKLRKNVLSTGVFLEHKSKQKVEGTNCYNCKYITDKAEQVFQNDLNDSGGIDPKNEFEMYRTEVSDLITLPGGAKNDVSDKRHCHHPKVKMYVTSRMCCSFWDNDQVQRPWKKAS